jgi:hypothetical protein
MYISAIDRIIKIDKIIENKKYILLNRFRILLFSIIICAKILLNKVPGKEAIEKAAK